MLPSRSKRFVSTEHGDLPRLRLAENWQLGLIALIMLGLFIVIFPRDALVKSLYGQKELDELTLFYIDNLHRTDPKNPDLSILLARAKQEKLDIATLEGLLTPVLDHGNESQRHEARQLLLHHYEQRLAQRESRNQPLVRPRLLDLLAQQQKSASLTSEEAGTLAVLAFRLGQQDQGLNLLQQAARNGGLPQGQTPAGLLSSLAQQSLGEGQHEQAARFFLLARSQTADLDEARQLFQAGIGALMASSRFPEAMQSAETALGDLANDAPTLRYLVRTALAAGDPPRAAAYARRLMFGEPKAIKENGR